MNDTKKTQITVKTVESIKNISGMSHCVFPIFDSKATDAIKKLLGADRVEKFEQYVQSFKKGEEPNLFSMPVYDGEIATLVAFNVKSSSLNKQDDIFAGLGACGKLFVSTAVKQVFFAGLESVKEVMAEGFASFFMGLYVYTKNRSQVNPAALNRIFILGDQDLSAVAKKASILVEGVNLTRNLVNDPSNLANPSALEREAKAFASHPQMTVKVLSQSQIKKMGMNLLNAVGMGSAEAPRLIHIAYRPKKKANKTIALVGKGVTFDTGGYSLKPQNFMYGMKSDMAGAGTCLGVAQIVSQLGAPVNIDFYIPAVENMVSERSVKPGDVHVGLNGKSVEIENTDAEGRLILADALSYAAKSKPDYLIDMATLTGACVVALGEDIFGLFSQSDELAQRLSEAASNSREKLWRLPLEQSYKKLLKSDVADLKNVGIRSGGAITAALFLSEFVGDTTWAHLDIAGPSFADNGNANSPKGATGIPVRTIYRFIENL